ncbi:hypothetical protein CCACVL1_13816 [Corchorus capsularis]|uniref:Uncharacterized protein n=1 Tax=Corchorus capsularis TaxID=210143 RepID=A0A1R3I9Q1_COCAP|nr:hypothetical protein CCACVL1_13816 [Corchorus capsularis]
MEPVNFNCESKGNARTVYLELG